MSDSTGAFDPASWTIAQFRGANPTSVHVDEAALQGGSSVFAPGAFKFGHWYDTFNTEDPVRYDRFDLEIKETSMPDPNTEGPFIVQGDAPPTVRVSIPQQTEYLDGIDAAIAQLQRERKKAAKDIKRKKREQRKRQEREQLEAKQRQDALDALHTIVKRVGKNPRDEDVIEAALGLLGR